MGTENQEKFAGSGQKESVIKNKRKECTGVRGPETGKKEKKRVRCGRRVH